MSAQSIYSLSRRIGLSTHRAKRLALWLSRQSRELTTEDVTEYASECRRLSSDQFNWLFA